MSLRGLPESDRRLLIVDDGPGFPPHLLPRLGQPYLSARHAPFGTRAPVGRGGEAQHLGLGIFIAQTLLERTGARLDFGNLPEGGAQVVVHWPRAALETSDSQRDDNPAGAGPASGRPPIEQGVPV